MSTDFLAILKKFSPFLSTNDSDPEIEYLKLLPFESISENIDLTKKLVIILVEPRLLETIPESTYSPTDLLKRLYNFKIDLQREGFQARFIEAKVYAGPIHKDGKTLLVIRELFKTIKNSYSNFDGAVLVGSFPEAMIVRTWLRPETFSFDIPAENAAFPAGTLAYHIGVGIHAYRSEIVLANLDGKWDNIYHQSETVPSGIFIPDTEEKLSPPWTRVVSKKGNYRLDSMNFKDFFWIKDDEWRVESQKQDSITLLMNSNQLDSTRAALYQLNPELGSFDQSSPNAIALPDIFVSRINAKHIAANPDSRLLDQNGKPSRIPYNAGISTDIFSWKHSADLERKLLIDYFDRNHAFRTGQFSSNGLSVSKIEFNLGLYNINEGLAGISAPSSEFQNASLLEFVKWLKMPILIRGISAHTSGRSACMTVFRNDKQYNQIELETGGTPWRWVHQNSEYIPSFEGHYTADLNLYRTIWENNVLKNTTPSFFLHMGFDVNTPDRADCASYCAPEYGACQAAESFLFYLNGLSIMSRSKMYNNGPDGFGYGFDSSDNAHFGNGWKEHFLNESQNTTLAKSPTERKKSSLWSICGDWTLKKYYTPISHLDNKPARLSSGYLKQSNLGRGRGIFELVNTSANNSFEYFARDNNDPNLNWYGPTLIDPIKIDACSLIQSNFGYMGNLEVVVRSGSQLFYFWREDLWPYEWHKETIAEFSEYDFCGNPAFIQSNLGGLRGNFELVVPIQSGGFSHFSRNNHIAGLPWNKPVFFGEMNIEISGVALLQSNFGHYGNLEVVAVEKNTGRLVHYWRENCPPYNWNGPFYFGGPGFTGVPSLIQRDLGGHSGNFELVVPVKGGGLAHYYRSNSQDGYPWYGPVYFGKAEVNTVSMVQSIIGQSSRLELVTMENGKVFTYRLEDVYPYNWHGPEEIHPIAISGTKKKKSQKSISSSVKEPVLV